MVQAPGLEPGLPGLQSGALPLELSLQKLFSRCSSQFLIDILLLGLGEILRRPKPNRSLLLISLEDPCRLAHVVERW